MMRYRFTIGLAAAAFAASLAPAAAQDRARPADAPSTGSAVPRDSGSSSGSSSSGSNSAGATSSSGSSSSGSGSSWMGSDASERPRQAPINPERAAYDDGQRRGGGTATGRAVPRDRGDGGGNSGGTASARSNDGGDRDSAQGRSRAVPTYSRPRDGRNPVGTAVERQGRYYDGYYRDGRPYSYTTFVYDPYYSYFYDPFYRGRYYWSPWGYGYGFGYMAYDPFWFGGFGYPDYYGGYYDPYYGGYSGGYGGGGYSTSSSRPYRGTGSLRLKVKPGHAQVFVDGYLVGTVDGFDGVFQRLNVEAGSHKIELRADGYEPTQFDVMVLPGKTITYEGDMRRR